MKLLLVVFLFSFNFLANFPEFSPFDFLSSNTRRIQNGRHVDESYRDMLLQFRNSVDVDYYFRKISRKIIAPIVAVNTEAHFVEFKLEVVVFK